MIEQRIAELLAELPPAPAAWIRAAQELPRAEREIDRLATLAGGDGALHAWLLEDPAGALRRAGLEPSPRVVARLRARLLES
jgi:hypothetical protein